MKKCRYIPESGLPPLAGPEQVEALRLACVEGRVKIVGKAKNYLTSVWFTDVDTFVDAIIEHISSGCRIFKKRDSATGNLLPDKIDASVYLREPEDNNDYDDGTVYVEFTLREAQVVIICDAHNHENGGRNLRLPN